jgi:hypothetical protein
MCECVKGKKCYTVVFGKITESEIVNETPKGYRVKNGKNRYEHMVYKIRTYSGWLSADERYFYTEKTVLNHDEALKICNDQIMCMENYYMAKLNKIQALKNKFIGE